MNQAHLDKWGQRVLADNKALQVPKESLFRVLWYVISSTALFIIPSLQLESLRNGCLNKAPEM